MALTKVQADGINLADTFSYTGTVTGTQGLVKLSTTTVSSAVASVDLTGMSSTYDFYQCHFTLTPATDNVNVFVRFIDSGGSALSSSVYGHGLINEGGGSLVSTNSATTMEIASSAGSDTNESVCGVLTIGPANSTTHPCSLYGQTTFINTSNNHQGTVLMGGLKSGSFQVITGLQFKCNTGNIEAGTFTLYGVAK